MYNYKNVHNYKVTILREIVASAGAAESIVSQNLSLFLENWDNHHNQQWGHNVTAVRADEPAAVIERRCLCSAQSEFHSWKKNRQKFEP